MGYFARKIEAVKDYYNNKWNGKYKGKDAPAGTYYYLITNTNFKIVIK